MGLPRLNGTVRERTKAIRAIKQNKSLVVNGFQIYYNYIRPHQALDGKTPAEAAHLNLQLGKNKWLDLIKLTSQTTKVITEAT